MAVDRDEVLHIARLAKLRLSEAEVPMFQQQLSDILDYVEQLNELETTDVEPTTHAVPLVMHLRPDVAEARLSHDEVLQNAPQTDDGQFRVPKVVES